MSIATSYNEFAPPPSPGMRKSLALAFLVHVLLIVSLSLVVQWRSAPQEVIVQAELWARVPVETAPSVTVAPPAPAVESEEVLPSTTPLKPQTAVLPDSNKESDIALEKKKKEELDKTKKALEKKEADKKALEKQKARADKDQRAKDERAKDAVDKKTADKKTKDELKKSDDRIREQKERALRLANDSVGKGDAGSTGTAAQSAGPSASYAGKIVAAVLPNVTWIEAISGNPVVDIEVRTNASGQILSRKIVASSGLKAWDDAALNALDKTERLPRDENGRVPSPMIISLRPRAR